MRNPLKIIAKLKFTGIVYLENLQEAVMFENGQPVGLQEWRRMPKKKIFSMFGLPGRVHQNNEAEEDELEEDVHRRKRLRDSRSHPGWNEPEDDEGLLSKGSRMVGRGISNVGHAAKLGLVAHGLYKVGRAINQGRGALSGAGDVFKDYKSGAGKVTKKFFGNTDLAKTAGHVIFGKETGGSMPIPKPPATGVIKPIKPIKSVKPGGNLRTVKSAKSFKIPGTPVPKYTIRPSPTTFTKSASGFKMRSYRPR